ncbi:M14 family metallopeptidase [Herbaspirillum sp. RV1423]|uniref:M14 family metallopeptidase n=1 Tax=Herbaspirillum sp. RV1423 TaxID=1443993 RepID=UPI0004B988E5|nr:M14 family metallopeptidase [Herbaspirillum sp. RV1423]
MKTLEQVRAQLKHYPVEVAFPDIDKWRDGNTGVDYVHSIDSGVAGPHVMILALMHGNEVSGAITVERLLQAGLRPRKGRVTLGFANVEAYRRFDARDPDANRFVDEDMNRVWSPSRLDGAEDSVELRRARQLRPVIDTVDYMLDLHSMHEEAPPLIVSGPLEKGIQFAADVGAPGHVIIDVGHPNGKRMRDYAGFGDPASAKNALLIETGQHFSARSKDVAMDSACRFMIATGVMPESDLRALMLPGDPPTQQFFRVTEPVVATSYDFEFADDYRGMEIIAKAGTVIAREGEREFVTPYDNCVIVMPSLRQLGPGVTVVRLGYVVAR